jgi:hypothetical protein
MKEAIAYAVALQELELKADRKPLNPSRFPVFVTNVDGRSD